MSKPSVVGIVTQLKELLHDYFLQVVAVATNIRPPRLNEWIHLTCFVTGVALIGWGVQLIFEHHKLRN